MKAKDVIAKYALLEIKDPSGKWVKIKSIWPKAELVEKHEDMVYVSSRKNTEMPAMMRITEKHAEFSAGEFRSGKTIKAEYRFVEK